MEILGRRSLYLDLERGGGEGSQGCQTANFLGQIAPNWLLKGAEIKYGGRILSSFQRRPVLYMVANQRGTDLVCRVRFPFFWWTFTLRI